MEGIWIDPVIMEIKRTAIDRLLLARICYRAAGADGMCRDSNRELGEVIGAHYQSVSDMVNKYKAEGLLTVDIDHNQRNLRTLTPISKLLIPYQSNADRYKSKTDRGYKSKTDSTISESLIGSKEFTDSTISDSLIPPKSTAYSYYKEEKTIENKEEKKEESTCRASLDTSPSELDSSAVIEAVVVEVLSEKKEPTPPPSARPPSSTAAMTRPTLEQVTTHMDLQMAPAWLAQDFFDFYESNGWKVGRNPMKKWQAAANKWIRDYKQSPNKNQHGQQRQPSQQTGRNGHREGRAEAGAEIDRLVEEYFGDGYR